MTERQIIKKLLKIIEQRDQTPPQKYKKLWKCLICNEIFKKKPFATRHIYCVHEKLLQKDFKVSEMPDHPKLMAIYRPEGSKEITEDDKFLQEVKNKYDEGMFSIHTNSFRFIPRFSLFYNLTHRKIFREPIDNTISHHRLRKGSGQQSKKRNICENF